MLVLALASSLMTLLISLILFTVCEQYLADT